MSAKIVATLAIAPGDTVIEIGPGRGALVEAILAARPGAYLALEKDRDLAAALARDYPEAAVANCDALRLDWRRLDRLTGHVRVISNLPYNIASPLLWDLCAGAGRFVRGVFMVQHEVARRLAAAPGGREYGALSAWIGNFVQVEYCFKVPPTVFRPPSQSGFGGGGLDPSAGGGTTGRSGGPVPPAQARVFRQAQAIAGNFEALLGGRPGGLFRGGGYRAAGPAGKICRPVPCGGWANLLKMRLDS